MGRALAPGSPERPSRRAQQRPVPILDEQSAQQFIDHAWWHQVVLSSITLFVFAFSINVLVNEVDTIAALRLSGLLVLALLAVPIWTWTSRNAITNKRFPQALKFAGTLLLLLYAVILYMACTFRKNELILANDVERSKKNDEPFSMLGVAVVICSGLEIFETGAFVLLVAIYL